MWSAEHGRSVNTICTAPVQDCEKSEIPEGYLYFQHPSYDIHRRHRNRQVIVINEVLVVCQFFYNYSRSVAGNRLP